MDLTGFYESKQLPKAITGSARFNMGEGMFYCQKALPFRDDNNEVWHLPGY
jgi:hypothetical protein